MGFSPLSPGSPNRGLVQGLGRGFPGDQGILDAMEQLRMFFIRYIIAAHHHLDQGILEQSRQR